MNDTKRNSLLVALFFVVFAVMFVFEALQAFGNSVQAHSPSTSTRGKRGVNRLPASYRLTPRASTRVNLTEEGEIYEE